MNSYPQVFQQILCTFIKFPMSAYPFYLLRFDWFEEHKTIKLLFSMSEKEL
jgi:hypothetical protein